MWFEHCNPHVLYRPTHRNLISITTWVSFVCQPTNFLFIDHSTRLRFADYILDDLQQSISRPGSSLGQPTSNYSSSHRDVHLLNPVNSTTVLRERSLSPNSNVSQESIITTISSTSHKIFYCFVSFSRTNCSKQRSTNTHPRLVADITASEETTTKSTNLIHF